MVEENGPNNKIVTRVQYGSTEVRLRKTATLDQGSNQSTTPRRPRGRPAGSRGSSARGAHDRTGLTGTTAGCQDPQRPMRGKGSRGPQAPGRKVLSSARRQMQQMVLNGWMMSAKSASKSTNDNMTMVVEDPDPGGADLGTIRTHVQPGLVTTVRPSGQDPQISGTQQAQGFRDDGTRAGGGGARVPRDLESECEKGKDPPERDVCERDEQPEIESDLP